MSIRDIGVDHLTLAINRLREAESMVSVVERTAADHLVFATLNVQIAQAAFALAALQTVKEGE